MIQESNKLIAEFMGLDFSSQEMREKYAVSISQNNGKYNQSWDWMFPVIQQINSLGKEYSLAIFKTYVSLTVEKGGKFYKDFSFSHAEYITLEQTPLEATYKLVIRFINWYNEKIIEKDLVV